MSEKIKSVVIDELKLENFERAFSSGSAGCRRTCACGLEYWDSSNNSWDFEEGEEASLASNPKAVAVPWSVGSVIFEGQERVADCKCWHERASKIMAFIDGHARGIAVYLNLEKKRLQSIANNAPTVT